MAIWQQRTAHAEVGNLSFHVIIPLVIGHTLEVLRHKICGTMLMLKIVSICFLTEGLRMPSHLELCC